MSTYNFDKLDEIIADLTELRDSIADIAMPAATREYPNNYYVYRHWSGEGTGRRCVYIGKGFADRAWSERVRDDEPYTIEVIVDGMDEETAYGVESAFLEDYRKTHGDSLPKYNVDGYNVYFSPVDTIAGPWQILWIKDGVVIEESRKFKTDVASIMGLLKSANSNKIGFNKGPWHTTLTADQYDHARIRFFNNA